MNPTTFDMLRQAYRAFNERNIAEVLSLMKPDVRWPNGWEGGYVYGHKGVEDYWKRQWKELDPHVEPITFIALEDGRIKILVRQLVKDHRGNILFDGYLHHIYTLSDHLIESMEIEKPGTLHT